MDKLSILIENILNDANKKKDSVGNKILTITILDEAFIQNVPRFSKLEPDVYYCYKETIIQMLKDHEISDKDKIKNILEITYRKCLSLKD